MEITLEKIELVKDRTGVTYREARKALEDADGNVVEAIIAIEDEVDKVSRKSGIGNSKDAIVGNIKDVVKKGNVSRILIKKDSETILNLPLTAGIFGAVLAPWGIIAGAVAAVGTKCKIELIKDDGSVVNINRKAEGFYEDAKEAGGKLKKTIPLKKRNHGCKCDSKDMDFDEDFGDFSDLEDFEESDLFKEYDKDFSECEEANCSDEECCEECCENIYVEDECEDSCCCTEDSCEKNSCIEDSCKEDSCVDDITSGISSLVDEDE